MFHSNVAGMPSCCWEADEKPLDLEVPQFWAKPGFLSFSATPCGCPVNLDIPTPTVIPHHSPIALPSGILKHDRGGTHRTGDASHCLPRGALKGVIAMALEAGRSTVQKNTATCH